MSKIAFIADVHAQRSAWANRPIEGDTQFALTQVAQICRDNDVGAVVGLGDLKERPVTKSYDDGLWLAFLQTLHAYGTKFLYVQGNHDKADPPCLWNYPNAEHIHEKEYEVPGRGTADELLYGLDYQDADSLPAALDGVPDGVTILCCHQRWSEFMGSATNPQGALKSVRGPMLWLLASGDLHETVVRDIDGDFGSFKFLSPGPPTVQSIVEDEDKYVFIAEDGTLRKIPLKGRRLVRSPMLNDRGAMEDFLERLPRLVSETREWAALEGLPPELHAPYLHVRYSYKLDDCSRRVQRLVGDKAHLFWKEVEPAAEENDAKVTVVARGEAVTPLGLLKTVVDVEAEPEVAALVERGLTARDKDAMRAAVKDYCVSFLGGDDVD